MFLLNPDHTITAIKVESELNYVTDLPPFGTYRELSDLAAKMPGETLVAIWNKLPGVTPIVASEKEQARGRKAKFRNRQTGVARIWAELCRLYPDAVSSQDMPVKQKKARKPKEKKNPETGTAWAGQLLAKLQETFQKGEDFATEQVYRFEGYFKRLHRKNSAIRPKLRQTLQVLRANGALKQVKRGQYRLK